MDWNAAIEKNREALKRVLAMLVAMATLPVAGAVNSTLPRHLHRAILRLLRPAETATRRLVIVAARGIVVTVTPIRPRQPPQRIPRNGLGTGVVMLPGLRPKAARRAARLRLPLIDPLPRWSDGFRRPAAKGIPRISFPGLIEPSPLRRMPLPTDAIDTTRLSLRLGALTHALDNLPAEARRYARWQARAAHAAAQDSRGVGRIRRTWPFRPGRPPGWRRRPTHDVHEILNVTHGLAIWALEKPDTS